MTNVSYLHAQRKEMGIEQLKDVWERSEVFLEA